MPISIAIEKPRCQFRLWMMAVLFPFFSFAQLNVNQNSSANTLAQVIAGSGVNISNAVINCGGNASGTFSYSGTNLGLASGIILTTGKANDASNAGTYLCNVNNGNNFSDPDLTNLVASASLDVCILEFDFVPICNSVNLNYVFGSEEYPQGVGSFNDAFGIFLTGPNPSGGNYTAKNIATLPNLSPVSINNVNASTNANFFHDNYSSPNNDIAYGGYTIPVTSVTSVVPCSTYKMKIAIADGGNALYDSGVLISGNGVSCQIPATITASATPSSGCSNTGSATASVTNFTGTATYQWMPGGQTAATINNLGAGTYTCVVSLHQTCGIITQTVTATVTSLGSNMVLTSTQQNLTCLSTSVGSATVGVIGGTAPFTCVWNTTPVQNGLIATNLPAGTYSATVTDNGGCTNNIQITITAPPAMQLNFSTVPATCTGATGSTSVIVAANGTAPYTYVWNTTQTTQSISNLVHGTYTVTVKDANSCTTTSVAIVGTQNPGWNLSPVTLSNINCFGGNNGSLSVNVNNPGGSTFSYSWNTSPVQSTQSIFNLSAGNYTCTVTDNNGCVNSVVANISQPALLTASVTSAPTICTGAAGYVSASAIGGTAPYTYLWSNAQNTNSIQGLSQGQYSVTITDAHNCSTSATTFVGSTNAVLQINSSVANSVCGGPSGAITISSVTNGTAPFSFSWATGQNTQNINGLSPGFYAVTVTDNNGCVGNTSIPVVITTVLPLTLSADSDYCNKGIGAATVIANGNAPYTYVWNTSTSQTTQTASNLSAGNYSVIVQDAYGCKDSATVTVANKSDLFSSVFSTQPGGDLFSENPIDLYVSTNGGWTFDNGALSDGTSISALNFNHVFNEQGNYAATYYFTSSNGCKDSVTYQIHIKDELTFYIPNSFSPNHDGKNDEFKAEGTLIKTFEMLIYDRWDNLIVKLNDISQGWDGKYKGHNAEEGVYVYKCIITDDTGEQTDFHGQINLIR